MFPLCFVGVGQRRGSLVAASGAMRLGGSHGQDWGGRGALMGRTGEGGEHRREETEISGESQDIIGIEGSRTGNLEIVFARKTRRIGR